MIDATRIVIEVAYALEYNAVPVVSTIITPSTQMPGGILE